MMRSSKPWNEHSCESCCRAPICDRSLHLCESCYEVGLELVLGGEGKSPDEIGPKAINEEIARRALSESAEELAGRLVDLVSHAEQVMKVVEEETRQKPPSTVPDTLGEMIRKPEGEK